MYNNDYLEKILGEQYNMSNYFADTYTEPNVDIIDTNDSTNIKNENSEENNSDIKDKINNLESTNTVVLDNKSKETLKDKINKTLNKDIYEISKLDNNKDNDNDKKNEKKNIIEQIKDYSIKEKTHQQIKTNQNNIENTEEIINEANSINDLYPEIYTVIEPIVELVVKNNINEEINSDLIESLTRKIYYAIEIDKEENSNLSDSIPVSGRPVNIKRKPQNSLLYDLIKILILNNFINNKPQRPIPPLHHHNNHRPPMPPPRSMNVSNNTNYFDTPFPEDE